MSGLRADDENNEHDLLVTAYRHVQKLSAEKRDAFLHALWESVYAQVPLEDFVLDLLTANERRSTRGVHQESEEVES